jgi:hypothetical protein
MAALPDEVAATIATAQIVQDEQERNDHLIKRVFGKLAKILAQATETEDVQPDDEGNQTNGDASTTPDAGTAYGYPPAYGVPANIAVQLLYDASKLLEKLLDEVSDEELINEIKELRERIAQALGISAQEFVSPVDIFREMRLAVTVSLDTQPVLPVAEAAARLRNAWDGFVQAVAQSEYALQIGKMFDAVFSLRAAVEAAIRSLSAVNIVETQNASQTALESNTSGDQDEEEVVQASEAGHDVGSGQPKVEGEQPDETIMEASDSSSNELAASSTQSDTLTLSDDKIASIVQEAIAPIVGRIEELMQRIEVVENAIKSRRRVSSFVASSKKEESDEDIWRKWLKASESERRMLLREAQRLLAAPVPFERD